MNRRNFVSRAALGAAAACSSIARPSFASPSTSGQLNVRFVGMMGFVERLDRSFLVATPGQSHHMTHVPFLMARAGSAIANELGCTSVRGVIPEAFDTALIGTRPSDFVFRSLANTALEVVVGTDNQVTNEANEMAQMNKIAQGKRVRGNIEKWASATVSLRGGRLQNSSGHPDAGKVWKFGAHQQRLTDAVNFNNPSGEAATVRLTSSAEAYNYRVPNGEQADLWVFSAASLEARGGDPTRLAHSQLLFDYLVDATPVLAECAEATGRQVPPTELPFVAPTSSSRGIIASPAIVPPDSEFCYVASFLLNLIGLGGKK